MNTTVRKWAGRAVIACMFCLVAAFCAGRAQGIPSPVFDVAMMVFAGLEIVAGLVWIVAVQRHPGSR